MDSRPEQERVSQPLLGNPEFAQGVNELKGLILSKKNYQEVYPAFERMQEGHSRVMKHAAEAIDRGVAEVPKGEQRAKLPWPDQSALFEREAGRHIRDRYREEIEKKSEEDPAYAQAAEDMQTKFQSLLNIATPKDDRLDVKVQASMIDEVLDILDIPEEIRNPNPWPMD